MGPRKFKEMLDQIPRLTPPSAEAEADARGPDIGQVRRTA